MRTFVARGGSVHHCGQHSVGGEVHRWIVAGKLSIRNQVASRRAVVKDRLKGAAGIVLAKESARFVAFAVAKDRDCVVHSGTTDIDYLSDAPRQPAYDRDQLRRLDGLGHVQIKSREHRAASIFGSGQRGQGNDGNTPRFFEIE